jgi:AAA15 family ATPase/GTPase
MRLKSVRVTNYKSVEDSEEFEVDDLTCLVGKNESGKTAILEALYKLQPIYDDETSKFSGSTQRTRGRGL